MTVNTTIRKQTFTGDGATTTFQIDFPVRTGDDLKVFLVDSGSTTEQGEGIHYVINDEPRGQIPAGFTITMTTAPPNGSQLFAYRETPFLMPVDIALNDPFLTEVLENAYDRLTMIFQEVDETLDRSSLTAITTPDSSGESLSSKLRFMTYIAAYQHLGSGVYNCAVVTPRNDNLWESHPDFPLDRFKAYEINGATDVDLSKVYPARMTKSSTGEFQFAFEKACECAKQSADNYQFRHIDSEFPSFVVDGNTMAVVSDHDFLNRISTKVGTEAPLKDFIQHIESGQYITDWQDSGDTTIVDNPTTIVLDDYLVYQYTGVNPGTPQGSGSERNGTCWTWQRVNTAPTPIRYTYASGEIPNPWAASDGQPRIGAPVETGVGPDDNLTYTSYNPFYVSPGVCKTEAIYREINVDYSGPTPDPEPDPVDCFENPDHPDCQGPPDDVEPTPDIWVQLRRCSDGTLVDLWRPESLAGVTSGLDLSKIVEISSVCYESSNVKADIPGTVADENAMTEHPDCTNCSTANTSCQYASTSVGPAYVFLAPNATSSFHGTAGAGTLSGYTVSDPDAANWSSVPLGYAPTLARTGNCEWKPSTSLDGLTGRIRGANPREWVYQYDAVAPNETTLTLTANGWELACWIGMEQTGPVYSYELTHWIKTTGDTPIGTYSPDTSKSAYLAAGTIECYESPNDDSRTSTIVPTPSPSGTDVQIAASDSDSTALTKWNSAWDNGYNCYFERGGVWNNDWSRTITTAANGIEIGWYGTGDPPKLRGSSNGGHVMNLTVSGNVQNLKFFGLDIDGRLDGSTFYSVKEDRVLFGFARPSSGVHTDNTLTDLEILDMRLHDGDNLMRFEDRWCFDRQNVAKDGTGPIGNRSQGYGFLENVKIHKCILHRASGKKNHSIGIAINGSKVDSTVEIFDNVFYKIGFAESRTAQDETEDGKNWPANKEEHGIYGIMGGAAGINVHDNWFVQTSATGAQLRTGGRFEKNIVMRSPMGCQFRYAGNVSDNVFYEIVDINPDARDRGAVIITWAYEGQIRAVRNNIIANFNATNNGQAPIRFSAFDNNWSIRDNTIVDIPKGNTGGACKTANGDNCISDKYHIAVERGTTGQGPCAGETFCFEFVGINNNVSYEGTDATSILAAFPTYTDAQVESNLIARTLNTWTIGTHDTNWLRDQFYDALP